MSEHSSQGGLVIPAVWWRTAMKGLLIAAVALIAYLIFERYLRTVVTVLLLAGMLTYLLQPIVNWVVELGKGKHVHVLRIIAVLVIYLLLAGIVVVYGAAMVHTIAVEKAALHVTWLNARQHIPEQVRRLQHWYETTIPAGIRGQLKLNLQHEASLFPTKYWPKILRLVSRLHADDRQNHRAVHRVDPVAVAVRLLFPHRLRQCARTGEILHPAAISPRHCPLRRGDGSYPAAIRQGPVVARRHCLGVW